MIWNSLSDRVLSAETVNT